MPALPPLSPRSRLHSAMLQTSLHAPPGFATLSAQLHMLYSDWEEGRVSLNPSKVLL